MLFFKNTHTQNKKKIKKNKSVVTIIFDGNFDRVNWPIDMRVWKGRRFEIILKLDRDLR